MAIVLLGCTKSQNSNISHQFTSMPEEETGIDFKNELVLSEDFDVFRYRNYYNGGGVAIGDVNNDGLPDIYLTANLHENRIYLNKEDFTFEDITAVAGVGGSKIWSTGVSMADVNGDGWLDIYVCNSGDIEGGKRENELFINQGVNQEGIPSFVESAAQYGLDDKGFSTHAVFFDYDQDGDLDCYVLNNSFRPVSTLGLENIRHVRDSTGGDKLYRNDSPPFAPPGGGKGGGVKFTDVSQQAGIYGSVIGFGLGVTITDVNLDGWLDIYISNDFFERDYLYINQKDGTFKDELTQRMGHISQFSMGADAADINNDGLSDIFVTDMLPESDYRLKTMTHFESYDVQQLKLANDYYEQNMRNTLQLNNGRGNFSEIGQYANVDATDWSWCALLADFDNDTHKEIFVSNGIYRDVTNQDFIDYLASDESLLTAMRQETVDFEKMVDKMPSNKLSNYLFKKGEGLQFENVAKQWGLAEPSFSNGAAYGDLDNDGDLDLIVNNVNQELFVYRNEANKITGNNYLKLSFQGPDRNKFGVGARVCAYTDGKVIMHENVPTKGFQSSMSYNMVVGLDTLQILDSLVIYWGYGKKQLLTAVETNRHLVLNIEDAVPFQNVQAPEQPALFSKAKVQLNPPYKHTENSFVDFNYERLIYHMLSREGPALTVADVNNDGLDDFYVGGASENAGMLYLQNAQGSFNATNVAVFEKDKIHEDVDAVFFDADGDNDLDLYVVSGGNSFRENAREYQDRLYLLKGFNNGIPVYEPSPQSLPMMYNMGSCVKPADYDQDGDTDLFVGNRAVPQKYGVPASSHILENDGNGNFTDVTMQVSPRLNSVGMVTNANWVDFDNDNDLDLVVVGEWLPITLFKNNGQNLERLNNVPGLEKTNGWWNSIISTDVNEDGNIDFIAGNWGLNSKFKASENKPFTLFVNDFDNNQTLDHVFAYYEDTSMYPTALRHDMVMQLTYLKKKFNYYEDYAGKTIEEVFTPEELNKSLEYKAYQFATSVIINNGDGSYQLKPLPEQAQFSPVFAISNNDFDKDGIKELLMAGNFSGTKPEEGKYDANTGLLLKPKSQLDFEALSVSGLNIKGDVRNLGIARTTGDKKLLIVARNNEDLEFYEY